MAFRALKFKEIYFTLARNWNSVDVKNLVVNAYDLVIYFIPWDRTAMFLFICVYYPFMH